MSTIPVVNAEIEMNLPDKFMYIGVSWSSSRSYEVQKPYLGMLEEL